MTSKGLSAAQVEEFKKWLSTEKLVADAEIDEYSRGGKATLASEFAHGRAWMAWKTEKKLAEMESRPLDASPQSAKRKEEESKE